MLFIGTSLDKAAARHEGFVAGRYRNGAYSDIWTDVTRCAEDTFTAYTAACECGWHGPVRPADPAGLDLCGQDWARDHRPAITEGLRGSAATRRVPVYSGIPIGA